ncbi:MAG: hypothetical protein AAGA46_03310 [Cyanobacteria bacterium P01_F01_bin.13]
MSSLPAIRVHSRVLDCGRAEVPVWYFSRWLDPSGSAKVCFTVEQAATFLQKGTSTIYRLLKAGEGIFWYRNTQVRSHIELHLVGIKQVCKNLQLGVHKSVLGAVADVPVETLQSRFGCKAMSTYLDALQLQAQAWWRASQSAPESIRHFVLKPWKQISSVKSTGASVGTKGKRQIDRYAFESEGWTIPGATIAGIRKRTDWRSDRTIQRRLSDKVRLQHGLEPLPKKRVAAEVTNPNVMAALANSCTGYLVDNNRVYKVLKHTAHEFFLLKHNIYGDDGIQLLGLRRLRGKVKHSLKNATTDINTGQK